MTRLDARPAANRRESGSRAWMIGAAILVFGYVAFFVMVGMKGNMSPGAVVALGLVIPILVGLMALLIYLPISIANERRHSKVDAIKACAWLSLLLWPLWVVAIIWAHTEDNRKSRWVR